MRTAVLTLMLMTGVAGQDAAPGATDHTPNGFFDVSDARWGELYRCAITTALVTIVEGDGNLVRSAVTEPAFEKPKEESSGPELDTPPYSGPGEWRTLAYGEGWFAGLDAGEWGGGLWWMQDGAAPVHLLAGPVAALARNAHGPFAMIADPYSTESHLNLLARDGPGWRVAASWTIPGYPSKVETTEHGAIVITEAGLFRWHGRHVRRLVHWENLDLDVLQLSRLEPFSVAETDTGIHVGMRLFLLRVPLDGNGEPQWFAPRQCASTAVIGETIDLGPGPLTLDRCICTG